MHAFVASAFASLHVHVRARVWTCVCVRARMGRMLACTSLQVCVCVHVWVWYGRDSDREESFLRCAHVAWRGRCSVATDPERWPFKTTHTQIEDVLLGSRREGDKVSHRLQDVAGPIFIEAARSCRQTVRGITA